MTNTSNMRMPNEENPKGQVSKKNDQPRTGHSLESFISITNEQTQSRHQPDSSSTNPATHLLSLLPNRTRLLIRLVSHRTKVWTDTSPSPLQHLRLTFPLSHYSLHDLAAFQSLSTYCTHLTVKLEPSKIELPDTRAENQSPLKLTHLTSLTDLDIIAPMYDEFFPLVAFRMALQGSRAESLRCMTISPVTIVGMIALRWGPFSSYMETSWAGAKVWRRLTRLELGLLPWWEDTYVDGDGTTERKRVRQPVEQWRTGVKVLHDWLASFASGEKIETLKVWWYEHEGPNPILLHSVAVGEGDPKWHGVKATTWRGLKYLWLDKCRVEMEDVIGIRIRCTDLEELWVEDEWIRGGDKEGVPGTPVYMDGAWWVKVWLGFDIEEEIKKLEAKKITVDREVEEKEAEEDAYADIGPSNVDVAEIERMYVKKVDSKSHEEYGGADEQSMEVPLILDV